MTHAPARLDRRTTHRGLTLAFALTGALLAGACHGGGGGGRRPGVDANASTVVVQPAGTRIANGTDAAPIVVTVLDTRGDPMPGLAVTLGATGNQNVLVQPATPTDANGMTFGFLTSTLAEAKVVGAQVTTTSGVVTLAATATVTFVGDPSTIDATLSLAAAVPATGVLADAVDASTITVTVQDAFGNPVSGQTVALAATGAGNTLTQPATTTDAAGVAAGSIRSTAAETKTITATINPGPNQVVVVQQPTVGFVADAGSIDSLLSTATANPASNVVANGADLSTITVTVVDGFGNPVAGQTVLLGTTGTNGTLTQPAATTDANGVASGTLASTMAETKTITATVNPGAGQVVLAAQPTVGFIADASSISATLSTVSATPLGGIAADGTTTASITVQVFDAFGNPVPGQTVALAATGSNNTLTQPPLPTDANGFAFGTLASTTAEPKTISATVNPGPSQVAILQQAVVTFSADPGTISGGLSTATAFPSTGVVANGTDVSTITVTVFDANGNPVPGQTVALGATGANNVITQPAGTTDAAGTTTGTIASTSSGTKTVTATINPGPNQVVVAMQPTVGFVGDPTTIDGTQTTATANPATNVVADGTATSTITVTVRDANGNPVAGQTVQLASTGTSNTLTQPASTTDASGATAGAIASTVAETKTITATVNPGPNQVVVAMQPTVGFVGNPATIDATLTTATANPTTNVVADGTTTSTITVTVRDANGNAVAGQSVQLASTGTGNTLTQPASTTDAAGATTGAIASTIAETKTITATVNPGPGQVVVAMQPTVGFVGDPATIDATLTTATANPTTNVVADGTTTSTITVTVRDANGNAVSGQTVQIASTGTGNTLTQPASTTGATGSTTGAIASTIAETKTITATVNPGPGQVVVAMQPTVDFVGNAATIDATLSTATANPATNVVADGTTTSTITVTVRDANGNAVAGQTVQLASSGTGNTLTQPASTTGATGSTTGAIASTIAETKTITATINPGPGQVVVAMQPTVGFVGNPATIDATLTTATANPTSNVVADGVTTSTITVTVRDANGNAVAGQTVQLASTGTGNTLAQPASTTDAAGVATGTIASTVAETKTITATVNPGPGQIVVAMQPTVGFVGNPGSVDATLTSATANPTTNVVADGATTSTITVTVRDANGNAVSGQTVQLASTGTGNTLTQPAATTDASGVATGAIASTTAETKTITATVNPGPGQVVVAMQPTVGFVGNPATIDATLTTATANPTTNVVADGTTTSTITVTVRDANGNAVAGQTVQLASTGTGNTLTQPASTTNASGVATGTIASTIAETKTITATVNPGPGQVVVAMQPTVGFVGNPATIDATLSTATAVPATNVLADGLTTSTITVTVRDANGNAVPGRTVQLASTGTGNVLTQPASTTNASGVATGTIASTVAETKTIMATIDPGAGQVVVLQQPTVAFVANPATIDPTLSTATANPSVGLIANGLDLSTITVTVRDASGNPVSGQTVQLAATGTGNVLTQPASTTNASGVATGTLASTSSETKTITATVNPGPGQVVLVQHPTATYGGDPTQIDATNSTIVASPSAFLAADGVDASTITVTVRDVNGAAVFGQTVVLSATGTSNAFVQPSATNAAGTATGSLASTAAESKTVTATINPGANQVVVAQHPTVSFVWNPTTARYVRATGTDPVGCTGGTTPATAWRTIGKAASCAPPGTTVYVGAGTYAESVQITQSGTVGSPIRFVADSAGTFTGDPGAVVVDAGGIGQAFRLDGVSWIEIEGFVVTGSGSSGGIHLGDGACSDVVLRGNRVHGNPYGIYVKNAASVTIEHNSISNNAGPGGDGLVVDSSDSVTVRDNLVYNNGRTGIDVINGSLGLLVDANTIYQNTDDQVSVDGSGNTVTLTNNVIALGAQDGVTFFVGSTLASNHNDVWGQTGSGWNGTAASPSDVSVDPRFVDPDGADGLLGGAQGVDDDFRLDAAWPSPVLDLGAVNASAVTTADGLTLADRTSRTDGTLDGSAPDGAALNLGYHYPVAGDAQPALAPGDVRITYGEGTMRQPRRRLYDDALATWTPEGSAPSTIDTIRWVVEKMSPLASGEELVATLAGTPAGGRIDLLRWSGQAWSRELRSTAIVGAEVAKRGFDLEYEAQSGDVMMVYSVNTSTPVYRTRTNAGWSAETPLPLNDGAGPNPDVNTGLVQWIEVESRPGTNEIAVAYSDSNRDLVAMTWNGTQWQTATATVLATDLWTSDTGGVVKNRAFDIAYEGVAGGLIAAWSRSTSGGIWYSRKAPGGSSYTTHAKIPSVPNFQPNFVDLGAEPGTSRMAVCGMDIEDLGTPERLALATWNATAWVNGGSYDSAAANLANTSDGDFPCAIGWVGTTGVAVCVYADDATGKLDWARWVSGTGWAVQPDVNVAGKGFTDSARIAYNGLGHLTALVGDATGKLWAMRYDGASWTVTNGGAALETGLSSSASVPFDAVQKNP